MAKRVKKKVSKKSKKKVSAVGRAYISSTNNNTIITLTDLEGNTVSWGSSGAAGFKGTRKSTPYAAQVAAEQAAQRARDRGLEQISIIMKGIGSGRESALRALHKAGLVITSISDVTPIPHNGCRPPKPRRV